MAGSGSDPDQTTSQQLRERGTHYYKQALALEAGDSSRGTLLGLARKLYTRAAQAADEEDDKASALKNCALAIQQQINSTLAQPTDRDEDYQQQVEEVLQLHRDGLLERSQAYLSGFYASKSEEWLDSMWEGFVSSSEACMEYAWAGLCMPDMLRLTLRVLLSTLRGLPSEVPAARCAYARDLVHNLENLMERLMSDPTGEGADWRTVLYLLAEAQAPLLEGMEVATELEDEDALEELLEKEHALEEYAARCRSAQACQQGDDLLLQALKLHERLHPLGGTEAADAAAGGQQQKDHHQSNQQQQQQQQQQDADDKRSRCARRNARKRANRRHRKQADGGASEDEGHENATKDQHQPNHHQQQPHQQCSTRHKAHFSKAAQQAVNSNHAPGSRQQAAQGDAGDQATREGDQLVVDGLLAAIDAYQAAVQLVRGVHTESEARAASKLGHLYKVARSMLDPWFSSQGARCSQERAKDCFKRVLLLVEGLPNKIYLFGQDWCREAREEVLRYQQSAAFKDEQAREQERAPIRELLREELAALALAAARGWDDLLKHVYAKHPPKNPAHRLAPDQVFCYDKGKELLRAAVVAYHPDKQAGQPVKCCVLCEEITKALNAKYECFKG